jgi:hypothetical protein
MQTHTVVHNVRSAAKQWAGIGSIMFHISSVTLPCVAICGVVWQLYAAVNSMTHVAWRRMK